MGVDAPNREAALRAVIQKEAKLAGDNATLKRARQIQKEQGPRAVMEDWQHGKPGERAKHAQVVDRNIGVTIDNDPMSPTLGEKKRNTQEGERFTKAEKWRRTSEALLDKGYNGLDREQKREVRVKVMDVLRATPEGSAIIEEIRRTNPTELQPMLENIINDPDFAPKLRVLFEKTMDPANAVAEIPEKVQQKFDEAQKKEDAKKRELERKKKDRNEANTKLKKDYRDPRVGIEVTPGESASACGRGIHATRSGAAGTPHAEFPGIAIGQPGCVVISTE